MAENRTLESIQNRFKNLSFPSTHCAINAPFCCSFLVSPSVDTCPKFCSGVTGAPPCALCAISTLLLIPGLPNTMEGSGMLQPPWLRVSRCHL